MHTQEYDFDVVWDGAIGHGVYLGALKGIDPFLVKPAAEIAQPAKDHWNTPTSQLIVALLTQRGPMTQTQLASACNRGAGDTRKALSRLSKRGTVLLEQPALFAIDPHDGQRWRLR